MDLNIFNRREQYKKEIQFLEKIYADYDIKLKSRKIHGGIRKTYPVLEFEGEGIGKFNEIAEKIKNAKCGNLLTDIGYAFIFPVRGAHPKRNFLPDNATYTTAIISPFPDNLRYKVVKLNKNLNVKNGDYIFIKRGFVQRNPYHPTHNGFFENVLYIEEVDNVDKVKAYKISQNLSGDFKDKIHAIFPQQAEKKEAEKVAACLLSANTGMGLFSIVNDKYVEKEISKIYTALQNSLPEIFRNEEISLNFGSGHFKKNSIRIIVKGTSLFENRNFEENPQQSLWFENASNNQTIASPRILGKIKDPLSLYRNANLINIFEFSQQGFSEGAEEQIYDEEIQFWLMSQRNLYSYAFDNLYVDKFFKKIFANVIQENLNLYLPENTLNLAVESTVIKESLHRGFESFCRKGDADTVENAEKFIHECLTDMSGFSCERGKDFIKDLEKRKKKGKKSGEIKQIYDLITTLFNVTGRVQYDKLVNAVKMDIKCDEQAVKCTINFINRTHPSIKIKFMDGIRVVEFR